MCRNSSCGWAHVVPGGWSVRGGHFRVRSPGPAPSSLGLSPSRCVGHCPGHPVPSFSFPSGALVAVSHGLRWQKVSEAGRSPLSSPLPSLLSYSPHGWLCPRSLRPGSGPRASPSLLFDSFNSPCGSLSLRLNLAQDAFSFWLKSGSGEWKLK